MSDKLREAIEEVCTKTLKDMNLTEDQIWEMSVKLSEFMLSEKSKSILNDIKDSAKQGAPENLERMYHVAFLAGYNCGMADQQNNSFSKRF